MSWAPEGGKAGKIQRKVTFADADATAEEVATGPLEKTESKRAKRTSMTDVEPEQIMGGMVQVGYTKMKKTYKRNALMASWNTFVMFFKSETSAKPFLVLDIDEASSIETSDGRVIIYSNMKVSPNLKKVRIFFKSQGDANEWCDKLIEVMSDSTSFTFSQNVSEKLGPGGKMWMINLDRPVTGSMSKKQKKKSMRIMSIRISARQTMRTFMGNVGYGRNHLTNMHMDDLMEELGNEIKENADEAKANGNPRKQPGGKKKAAKKNRGAGGKFSGNVVENRKKELEELVEKLEKELADAKKELEEINGLKSLKGGLKK